MQVSYRLQIANNYIIIDIQSFLLHSICSSHQSKNCKMKSLLFAALATTLAIYAFAAPGKSILQNFIFCFSELCNLMTWSPHVFTKNEFRIFTKFFFNSSNSLFVQSICTHFSSLSGRPDTFLGSGTLKKN